MVGTAQDIVTLVYAAKADPDAADGLIKQYMGFIRAEARKLSFGDGEDELSIAMLAFYEAALGYEKNRGAFLQYAAKVIRSRLIDYHRARAATAATLPHRRAPRPTARSCWSCCRTRATASAR